MAVTSGLLLTERLGSLQYSAYIPTCLTSRRLWR